MFSIFFGPIDNARNMHSAAYYW